MKLRYLLIVAFTFGNIELLHFFIRSYNDNLMFVSSGEVVDQLRSLQFDEWTVKWKRNESVDYQRTKWMNTNINTSSWNREGTKTCPWGGRNKNSKLQNGVPVRYMQFNAARSGSSYLQELLYNHPDAFPQFEKHPSAAEAALNCVDCGGQRPTKGNLKVKKAPRVCGFNWFPPRNCSPPCGYVTVNDVSLVAETYSAAIILLFRRSWGAHAISKWRMFDMKKENTDGTIPITSEVLAKEILFAIEEYDRLVHLAVRVTSRPVHIIFYEALTDHKQRSAVTKRLLDFLLLENMQLVSIEKKTSRRHWLQYIPTGVYNRTRLLLHQKFPETHALFESEPLTWEDTLEAAFLKICEQRYLFAPDCAPLSWYKGVCVQGQQITFDTTTPPPKIK